MRERISFFFIIIITSLFIQRITIITIAIAIATTISITDYNYNNNEDNPK